MTNDIHVRIGPRDREAIRALSRCTFLPGTNAKRFVRSMAAMAVSDLARWTPAQSDFLWDLVWHYRRQIPDAALVEEGRRVHDGPNCLGSDSNRLMQLELETEDGG